MMRPKHFNYAEDRDYIEALKEYCDGLEQQLAKLKYASPQAAQPAGERGKPVAYLVYANGSHKYMVLTFDPKNVPLIYQGGDVVPLYTTPQPAAQPSEWVGLSDEEANALWESTDSDWELMKRTEKLLREKNAGKPAANQCKPMGLEESVTDVRVCCGEYAKCHRACTPRGRWQATQEAAEDKAGGDEPVASLYITPSGEREFDDWNCPLPAGRNVLYTRPQPQGGSK